MRRIVVRVLAVSPLVLAALLLASDWAVARLVLPFREAVVALLAAQVVVAVLLALRRGDAARARVAWAGLAVVAIAVGSATYLREYADHREEVVRFPAAGAELAGTLYTPVAPGPYAGIVLVHGSGKFPRRLYRLWAHGLVRLGFQVLAYDKRGVGDSGGRYEGENNTSTENLRLLADDAAHAVDYLVGRGGVTAHIGLFGVSQGGWVGPLAAQKNPRVRFLVMHSGPTVSVGEENLYSELTGDHAASEVQRLEAETKVARYGPHGFDPRPVLRELDVTALWLYGDSDASIPVRNSVSVIEGLASEGKPFQYKLFARADHLLLTREGNTLPDLPPTYWNTIAQWARQHEHRSLAVASAPAHR
jgi:dienelactone hydrolase